MDRARLVELFEVVLIALACPLALLFLKEAEKENTMPRYIDADALKYKIEQHSYPLSDRINSIENGMFLCGIYQAIDESTTADAVPVVRGEWVLQGENEHDYETSLEEKCSLCGRYVYRYDTQPQDNYCPNCGAKMGSKGST